jgi:hypothetical protein
MQCRTRKRTEGNILVEHRAPPTKSGTNVYAYACFSIK